MMVGGGNRRTGKSSRKPAPAQPPGSTEVFRGIGRHVGRDSPYILEIPYNYADISSDGTGLFSNSDYWTPTALPNWSTLKTLFSEFKLYDARLHIQTHMGNDADGIITMRYDPDPSGTILSTLDLEQERGASVFPVAALKTMSIGLHPRTFESSEWHPIDSVTDSNNYGYNKEYGQVFERGQFIANSTTFGKRFFSCRVGFRGFKS